MEITSGAYKGQRHKLLNQLTGHPYFDLKLEEGMKLLLWGEIDANGTLRNIYVQDYARIIIYTCWQLYLYFLSLLLAVKRLDYSCDPGITVAVVFFVLLPFIERLFTYSHHISGGGSPYYRHHPGAFGRQAQ